MRDRKTVYGVGYNSGGTYKVSVDSRKTPEYSVWYSMMERCYSKKVHEKYPSYADCFVSDSWHDFQAFAKWLVGNDFYGLGYSLDKDLLLTGNKCYSEDTCVLVPACINTLLIDNRAVRGKYPVGVTYHKSSGNFQARINVKGKRKYLGNFPTPDEAYIAYAVAKAEHVREMADEWYGRIDERVYNSLMRWSAVYE